MYRLLTIARATALLCAGSTLATVVQAQATIEATRPESLRRVEVTGSRIKRIEAVGASAIQSISRDEIEASGATSLDELLRSLTAAGGGSLAMAQSGSEAATFGASGISLRGLGTTATLVLIDGRRVAPFGFSNKSTKTFVNTNAIPIAAIERIDVLLDGASAIYGADAIAGVVNIVLRKSYNGAEITGSAGQSIYSDNKRGMLGATWGRSTVGPGAYDVMVNYTHTEQYPVLAVDRPRTADGDYSEYGLANYMTNAYRNVYKLTNKTGDFPSTFIGRLTNTEANTDTNCTQATPISPCKFNPNSAVWLVNRASSDALFASGHWDVSGNLEIFGNASLYSDRNRVNKWNYDTTNYKLFYPLSQDRLGQFGNAPGAPVNYLILAPGHPQNPTATSFVGVLYRFDDVARVARTDNLNQRYTLGLRGEYANWDLESALVLSRSEVKQVNTGFLNDTVFRTEVLDANGYVNNSFLLGNPAMTDRALMDRLYPTLRSRARTDVDSVDARGTRELWQLPAGPVGVAVGAEIRRESQQANPDNLLNTDQLSLISQYQFHGSRTSDAVYGELVAPVLSNLELTLAARRDHYSDFGAATTPKAGLKWTAVPEHLVLRSTYSEGFRAPSLAESMIRKDISFLYVQDPKRCAINVKGAAGCEDYIQQITTKLGDLLPETAKSFTLGMELHPTRTMSLAVDAYQIKRKNEISTPDPQQVLNAEDSWPQLVVRDNSGQVVSVTTPTTNRGSTSVRGVDLEGKLRLSLSEGLGTLDLKVNYSKTFSYAYSLQPGEPIVEYVGYYLHPRERGRLSATWRVADWSFNIISNQVGAYLLQTDPSFRCKYSGQTTENYCLIPKWSTASAYIAYMGFRGLTLGLNISDIENRGAPLDASRLGSSSAYNSTFHSVVGRNVTLSGTYKF